MHSHDRTFLANLGFADPDKADPIHDVACRYLCQPAIFDKLVVPFFRKPKYNIQKTRGGEWTQTTWEPIGPPELRHEQEHLISKGEGKYKTHVGFLDVILKGKQNYKSPEGFEDHSKIEIALEVKIKEVSASEIIRQITFYKDYFSADAWCAVTAFDLVPDSVASLRNAKIVHFVLGKKFDEYVSARQSSGAVANSPEI